jgi:hypothetical protein
MATIIVHGVRTDVTLVGPDEDGDYMYRCAHGHSDDEWGYQPLEDMVSAAEKHADHDCPGGPSNE